jgi:hypothetical protein
MVQLTHPNGQKESAGALPFTFKPREEASVTILMPVAFTAEVGLYWWDVFCDGTPLTRVPLRTKQDVQFVPTETSDEPRPPGPSANPQEPGGGESPVGPAK